MTFENFGGHLNRGFVWHGARAADVSYGSPRQCHRHAHEHAFFSFLATGAYHETFANRTTLKHCPGTVVFHPPDTVHADSIGESGTRFMLLSVSGPWLEITAEQRRGAQQPTLCEPQATQIMRRLYTQLQQGCDSLLFEEAVFQLLWSIHPRRLAVSARKSRWLHRVIELLHAEFASSLTLSSIARQMNLHPAYLSRSFRGVYGQNLGEYVMRIRVSHATLKMATTDMTLTEIAHASGFADHSHFTRVFRQLKGLSPSRYRESLNSRRTNPDACKCG